VLLMSKPAAILGAGLQGFELSNQALPHELKAVIALVVSAEAVKQADGVAPAQAEEALDGQAIDTRDFEGAQLSQGGVQMFKPSGLPGQNQIVHQSLCCGTVLAQRPFLASELRVQWPGCPTIPRPGRRPLGPPSPACKARRIGSRAGKARPA
jgi:hypothetical protein